MSNRNQYYGNAPPSNSGQYYAYPEDDSGNYQHDAYAPSYAPRAGTEDVAHLESGFGSMNIQDDPSPGQDASYQPEYSHYPTGPDASVAGDPYRGQGQQYGSPPQTVHASSSAKGKGVDKNSRSNQKGRDNPRDKESKTSKKSHGKKPDKRYNDGPFDAPPFYARPAETKHGDPPTHEHHPVGTQGINYPEEDDQQGVYQQEDHSDILSGQDYQHDDYSHEVYSETRSRQGQQRSEQRAEYPDSSYQDVKSPEAYVDHLSAGPSSNYTGAEDPDMASYRQQGDPSSRGQWAESYPRSSKSKDAKSSSGRRSKKEPHRDDYPPSSAAGNFPPVLENPDLTEVLRQSDGYHRGGSDYSETPLPLHSHQRGYSRYDDDEGTGAQTPKPSTSSGRGQPPTYLPGTETNAYEPYPPSYPQSSGGQGAHASINPEYGSSYEQGPSHGYGSSADYGSSYEPGPSYSYPNTATYSSNYEPGLPHAYSNPADSIADDADGGDLLDGRYVVQHSSRFAPGEVFKVLWPEPMGGGGSKQSEAVTDVTEREHKGQKFYVGFRRFIVVANDEGHCTCVPILTYERRACTKKGVKPNKHGIVYSIPGRPQLLKDEPRLGFAAVRLQVDIQTEKLAMESRVNYSKLVTVEHNVKVFFIGRIAQDDMAIVDTAVNQCWADKVRKENEGSHQPRYKNQHDQRRRDRRP